MKTFRLIGMAVMAVLMCVNFTSCSSDDSDIEPSVPQKPKEYMVSLGFTGEITISEGPLSRVSGNDLYGIQVYSCPDSSTDYANYAYGLFDDVSSATIKLLKGYKYKFIATMVVDGKNKIKKSYDGKYFQPFGYVTQPSITNSFIYTTKESLIEAFGITDGYSYLSSDKEYSRPNTDRFYGEQSDYVPTENGNISINMLRTVYGLKVIANNLTEGTLNISMDGAPQMNVIYPNSEIEDIFTFCYVSKAYSSDGYSETVATSFTWTRNDGVAIPLGTHDITFKRNKQTIVTVEIGDASVDNDLNLSLESDGMTEGDKYSIKK